MNNDIALNHPSFDIGFIDKFKDKNDKTIKYPLYYDLSDYLIKVRGFKTVGKYNHIFKDTHYIQITDEMVNKVIIELTLRECPPGWLGNFFKILRSEAQIERDDFKHPEGIINLANGMLDLKTKFLCRHQDSCFFKYVIPIEFDKEAKCPDFMEFLEFVFENDKELINATAEIFGYCLLGGDPFLHKSFVLLGDGRNGKSTWLHVLRKLVGDSNCSSVSMGLLNKPFSAVRLDGKLANITGELPTSKLDSEVFKSAVGGEYITAAHKGKDEYGLHVEARFVFACNDMPKFGDATTGMWEKLYMIPFNRYIRPEERDPGIFKRLEGELPGVLNFALEGLARLVKRGKLKKIKAVDDTMIEYREESDSVYDFFEQKLEVNLDCPDKEIKLKFFHNAYQSFCVLEGKKSINNVNFSKRLRRILKEKSMLGVSVNSEKIKIGRVFTGLRLKIDTEDKTKSLSPL